ncbi:MAG: phosphate ABC transporter permease PstA [Planctomycetota bacterium]|nr:phosphate ABC transporter permease PstA [Planctomycetota bacterium]MDA1142844.1 phosphate ABC transporter permease PstA [Planctomycetota bacterium]
MSLPTTKEPGKKDRVSRRRPGGSNSLTARGEPMLWLTGGALAFCIAMIAGLLSLVLVQGTVTFWPKPVYRIKTKEGQSYLGERRRSERFQPSKAVIEALPLEIATQAREELSRAGGWSKRQLLRTGNFEISGEHFKWISDFAIAETIEPAWALVIERLEWGLFYGIPKAFLIDGEPTAKTPEETWPLFRQHHEDVRQRWRKRRRLELVEIGEVNERAESARLAVRQAKMDHGDTSDEYLGAEAEYDEVRRETDREFARIREQIDALNQANDRFVLLMETADGKEVRIRLADVVRAYPANQLGFLAKCGIYASRWWEFITDEPREANSEGGVFPAIFGTVIMTLIMSLVVVPFGILAALYLREYAKPGLVASAVRISINNLAGVPSIVFGVFGLGFFSYLVGGSIDHLFFSAKLPSPTYGTGGILWSSLTLALLTLPVVIVATEEALAAVPSSMREGSYACGASKWQTIRRIVLPRAMPGIMTGMILAMARGAGEVAPLMLVGAVKLAPDLPLDGIFPYLHPERSFMHLGFHIYDLGFQSQNSEAAKPMVYTTTLLLIAIITVLNLAAIWIRARLRRKFIAAHF